MMKKGGWIIFALCVMFWMGCSATVKPPEFVEPIASVETHQTPEDVQSQIEALFPEDGEFPGWQKRSEVAFFDQETLFQHINGAAEAFFAYDFQQIPGKQRNPQCYLFCRAKGWCPARRGLS
jgi:hypothetical protein